MIKAEGADLARFIEGLKAGRPQVVVRRLIDDLETPVSAFLKLGRDRPYACLLESVEGGRTRGRYSLIGLDPDLAFRAQGHRAQFASAVTGVERERHGHRRGAGARGSGQRAHAVRVR